MWLMFHKFQAPAWIATPAGASLFQLSADKDHDQGGGPGQVVFALLFPAYSPCRQQFLCVPKQSAEGILSA
jgi:hypothetical protein